MTNITPEQLRAEFKIDQILTQVFDYALEVFIDLVSRNNRIPYDSGNLVEGIRAESVDSSNYTASFVSTALSDEGFDYPELLNRASSWRVEPVNAEALSWSSNGNTFFSRGHTINNRHVGWWDREVNREELWDQAVREAAVGLL